MSRHKLTVRDLEDSWACKHAQEDLSSDERVAEIRTLLDEVRAEAWDEGYGEGEKDGMTLGHPLGTLDDLDRAENPYWEQEKPR